MTRRHRHMRAVTAWIAAYGLVLQAALLGLVLGATAAPSAASAWAILCTPSGLAPATDGAPSGQKGAPACCVAGACGLSFGLPGAPAALASLPTGHLGQPSRVGMRDLVLQDARGPQFRARAPPRAAV